MLSIGSVQTVTVNLFLTVSGSGARNSILISVIATVINLVIGVFVGGIWGISKSVDRDDGSL